MSFVGKSEVVKVIITHNISNEDMDYLQNQFKISQIIVYGNPRDGKKVGGSASNTQ